MAKSNLLKEAIADAKAVRETAIANARLALEEAFTPKIQSMLSKKIEEEADDMEETEIEEQTDSSKIGTGDNKVDVADGDDTEKSETETSSAAYGSEDSNNTTVDKLTEEEDEDHKEMKDMDEGEEDETTDEGSYKEDEEMEEDLDLEAIIRELETTDEDEDMDEDEDPEEMAMETEKEDDPAEMAYKEGEDEDHQEMKDMDEDEDPEEELDLDEIIKSLKEEDEDETKEEGEDEEMKEVKNLTTKLQEAYSTIKSLKGTINEVNLLNAKLLFSNKLFKSHNLTEGQKMKIIETFDRAQSTREVKLVYSTLAESLSSGATKKRTIKESFASKTTRSTKPSPKAVIVEADQFTNRMKKLAGLL